MMMSIGQGPFLPKTSMIQAQTAVTAGIRRILYKACQICLLPISRLASKRFFLRPAEAKDFSYAHPKTSALDHSAT